MIEIVPLLALLAAQAAAPPSLPANPPAADVAASLDRMLDAKDYNNLCTAALSVGSVPALRPYLDWEQARMTRGASAIVAFMYARDLWRTAAALPAEQGNMLRQTAAGTLLYAYGAVQIDGARCADATAPQNRLDQLITIYRDVWAFLRAASVAEREQIVRLALLIDARSAAARTAQGDDEFLCRYGMEETSYGLQHGTARDVPTAPGQVGRTIAVTSEGYRPRIRPESEARPIADRHRAALHQTLNQLAGLP